MADADVSITFIKDHEVQDENRGTPNATVYRAGKAYRMGEASALHFLARGLAQKTGDGKAEKRAAGAAASDV